MSSLHRDEARAADYRDFLFDFLRKILAERAVVIAGGTGGLER